MPDLLTQEIALRNAIAREDFASAQAAAAQYGKLLEASVQSAGPAEALLSHGCELLEWSRRSLCAIRAFDVAKLQRLQRLSRYEGTPGAIHTWKLHL